MGQKDKSYLNDIGRFTSFTFIGEVGRYIFLIISSALVTNFFGAELFGQYSYIISFITILITVSGMGLGTGVIYFTQKHLQGGNVKKERGVIGFAYLLVSAFSLAITLLVIIFSEPISVFLLNSSESSQLLKVMAPLIFIEAVFNLSISVFKSQKRIARLAFVKNLLYHILRITAILVVFLVLDIRNINGIIIPTYAGYSLILIYSLFSQYKNHEIGKASSLEKDEKIEIIKYSLPLFMSAILGIMLAQTDVLMIGYIKGDEAVAVYKISIQICAIIPFIKHMTGTFFSPMISTMYHSGKRKEMIHVFSTLTKWEMTFGLLVFIGIALYGKSILHIFGEEFITGHTALIIVACGSVIKVFSGQGGNVIAMTGHTRFNLATSLVTFIINIILNILLIPRHGIVGAAVATLISIIVGHSMSILYLFITQRIHPYSMEFLKPITAGITSFIFIRLINRFFIWDGFTDILIKGSIYVIVFIGMLFILRINKDDITILKGMVSAITGLFKRGMRKR